MTGFTKKQIAGMVGDACQVESLVEEHGGVWPSLHVLDCCCHVKALASEVERLHDEVTWFRRAVIDLTQRLEKELEKRR